MVFAIQAAIFLAAFFSKKKYLTLILAIAALVLPDEIPMLDEILMLATTARAFYLDSKGASRRGEIPPGESENDVGT